MKEPGVGGLPVGTSGRVLALLSGGIDSPVAAWRLIRRGCRADFVHFHSYPILSNALAGKGPRTCAAAHALSVTVALFLVPFGSIQQQVVVDRTGLMRACRLSPAHDAHRRAIGRGSGAHALVTGDSVGQVASQTIDNWPRSAPSRATGPPAAVGFHKEEITLDAQQDRHYQTSILPDEDCCTLFTPRYPTTARGREADFARRISTSWPLVRRAVKRHRGGIRIPDAKLAPARRRRRDGTR
jgi:thiamine biosynthesis protein ThiI